MLPDQLRNAYSAARLTEHCPEPNSEPGRLSDAEIEKFLREEIRRRATNELFEAMDRMSAVEGAPPRNAIWQLRKTWRA